MAQKEKLLRQDLKIEKDKNLTFAQVKELENKIFNKFRVIVTTCGCASNSRLLTSRIFTRVLMDEATMIKELDSFVPTKNAKQLVLIGD